MRIFKMVVITLCLLFALMLLIACKSEDENVDTVSSTTLSNSDVSETDISDVMDVEISEDMVSVSDINQTDLSEIEEGRSYTSIDIGNLIIEPAYVDSDNCWHWPAEGSSSTSYSGGKVTTVCDLSGFVNASNTDILEKELGVIRLDIYNWDENRFDYDGCILTLHIDSVVLSGEGKTIRLNGYEKRYELEMRTDVEEMGRNFTAIDISSITGISSFTELAQYTMTLQATVVDYKVSYIEQ